MNLHLTNFYRVFIDFGLKFSKSKSILDDISKLHKRFLKEEKLQKLRVIKNAFNSLKHTRKNLKNLWKLYFWTFKISRTRLLVHCQAGQLFCLLKCQNCIKEKHLPAYLVKHLHFSIGENLCWTDSSHKL